MGQWYVLQQHIYYTKENKADTEAACDSIYMKGSDAGKATETGSRSLVCQGWGLGVGEWGDDSKRAQGFFGGPGRCFKTD